MLLSGCVVFQKKNKNNKNKKKQKKKKTMFRAKVSFPSSGKKRMGMVFSELGLRGLFSVRGQSMCVNDYPQFHPRMETRLPSERSRLWWNSRR